MIKNVLDTILKIEEDSKAQVAKAQEKARDIKEAAEKENAERLNAARAQAASGLLASVTKTKEEWEEKYQKKLASQDTLYADFIKSKDQEIDRTADKILTIIINPQHKK